MNRYCKKLVTILLTAVFLWLAPVIPVMAIEEGPIGNSQTGTAVSDNGAEVAEGQVVVMYEDGEIPSGTAGTKRLKAKGNPAVNAQKRIIENAIDGDFSIDDTIVIESADEAESDMVVGVVSSDGYTAEELAGTLQNAEGIKYAEPNYKYTISSVPDWNDTYINDAWQLDENGVNVRKAPAPAGSGKPVVLAVMDTGIDYTHPDLEKRMWTAPSGFSLNGEHGVDWFDKDDDPMDENGHGTHCAGIIAAAADNKEGIAGITGKTANIQLMSVKVLDSEGNGYLEDIVKGFKYLVRAKKEGVNIKAVNCSFGAGATSDIFDEAIEQAGQAGILTIVAAGNEKSNNDSTNVSPANSKSDYVLVVAATDEDGSLASYSNYGKKNVDIGAPGSNILSSVSYFNYAPFLYNAENIRATTQVYGEFGDAMLLTDKETGEQYVTPALGTDYNGSNISGVDSFGESRMFSIQNKGSKGKASLDLTDGSITDSFGIGNNQISLRWRIDNAEAGEEYVLYFPYDKLKGNQYINMVFRTHTGEGEGNGMGALFAGDVKVDDVDSEGNITFSTSAEESMLEFPVEPAWNSIWQASGIENALYDRTAVKDLEDGQYGLGLVYEAGMDGDVYIDISSLAISKADADIERFGAYDVYSGTSMAAPVVTGAAGLIAAANPDIGAEPLKAALMGTTTSTSSLAGMCSTGSRIDFASYIRAASEAKPSISSATADFSKGTVTLKGRGFGKLPKLKVYRNAVAEGDGLVKIKPSDIKAGENAITISNAGYSGYDLIGSDVRFELSNGDKSGEASFYVVKGLSPYDDEFETAYEASEDYFMWNNNETKAAQEDGSKEEDQTTAEEVPEDPIMPAGLSYVNGANDLYKYSSTGDIYRLEKNDTNGKYYPVLKGITVNEMLNGYAETAAAKSDYWIPDSKEDAGTLNYYLAASPVYMGNVIYELICVDMVDRDAFILAGLNLSDDADEWTVYYDSLTGLGKAPSQLDLRSIEKATMVGYGGRLYLLGGNKEEIYDEARDEYSVKINTDYFSCKPNRKGTAWKYEGQLPKARTNGRAIVSNGKLYYFLTNDEEGLIDYSVYAFDGKTWTKADELPKALFADSDDAIISMIGDIFTISWDDTDKILCATGIDSKGILFAGKSFDGPGDTFRFNTKTNKIEPLKYTLWGTVSDRQVDGIANGNKFFVEYTKESTNEAICKSFPIESGYVMLNRSVTGEGSGIVTGGGSYAKGDKSPISITPDKGSYIYSISSSGINPDLNKKYGKSTKESRKTITATYNATTDGSIEVYFGKVSTKVIVPKKTIKKAVGKRTVKAHTNGTINGIKWKSSNNRYARVNKDGTITFKRAGVGKTVTLTASSAEKPSLKAKCKVKIVSRQRTKFVWNTRKITSKVKVLVDRPLKKTKAPKKFKVNKRKGKAVLSWKKAKNVSGYIVFRKTGKSRYKQIAKLSAKRKSYTDKKVKKGKKYRYMVVSYKKVKGSKAVRISPCTATKKFKKK